MMDVLPSVPVILLAVVAVWFYWPLIADPITGRQNRFRRTLSDNADDVADDLFDAWPERQKS